MKTKIVIKSALELVLALLLAIGLCAAIIYAGGLLYEFNLGCFVTYIALLIAPVFSAKLDK